MGRGKSIYRFCPFVHILSSLHHYNHPSSSLLKILDYYPDFSNYANHV